MRGSLPCADWARGIDMQFATLGIAYSFVSSGIGPLDIPGLMARMAGGQQRTWDGLHVSLRTAPSKVSKCARIIIALGRTEVYSSLAANQAEWME